MKMFPYILLGAIIGMVPVILDKLDSNDSDGPTDNTGRTSIVVEYENGDWCELRGPGRFTLLNEWEACSDYDN